MKCENENRNVGEHWTRYNFHYAKCFQTLHIHSLALIGIPFHNIFFKLKIFRFFLLWFKHVRCSLHNISSIINFFSILDILKWMNKMRSQDIYKYLVWKWHGGEERMVENCNFHYELFTFSSETTDNFPLDSHCGWVRKNVEREEGNLWPKIFISIISSVGWKL